MTLHLLLKDLSNYLPMKLDKIFFLLVQRLTNIWLISFFALCLCDLTVGTQFLLQTKEEKKSIRKTLRVCSSCQALGFFCSASDSELQMTFFWTILLFYRSLS